MKDFLKKLKTATTVKKGSHSLVANISKEMIEGPMRGWLCGHFYPRDSLFHRKDIEICVKVLPVGMTEPKHFHLCSFEFLIVLSGIVEYNIDGLHHVIEPGMFYMLEPGEVEHIVEVKEECTILCVRLPSIPNNKIMEPQGITRSDE